MVYRQTAHTKQKKAGTRERILKEAKALVTEGGFAAASVVAVAQRSGIATGTIYRHFPSKGELVAEVFRMASGGELEAVTAASQIDETPEVRLSRAVETFASRALKAPRLAYALIAEPVDPLVEAERLRYRFAYSEAFEDLIEDGVKSQAFAPQNASICSGALVGMLAESLVGPLSPQLSSIDEQVSEREALQPPAKDELLTEIIAMALRAVGCTRSRASSD